MSYDLLFTARSGEPITKRAFDSYFRERPNYQLGEEQAVYQNEDTGVYFIFDAPQDGVVAFNLNYFRPHVFGLEAAPELAAFAKAFEAAAGDPQGEMGDDGEFTTEGFLRGWNAGNQFAYRSMLKQQSDPVYTWPAERIRAVWNWNYSRRAQQEQAGENVFVPAIFALDINGQASSVAIWPPDCAILLPTVDGVLVPVTQSPESEQLSLVLWDEIQPVIASHAEQGPTGTQYRLAFQQWPAEIAEFLAKRRGVTDPIKGIALDQVLDLELVESAKGA